MVVRWTPPEGIRHDTNLLGYEIQWKSGTQDYGASRSVTFDKAGSDGKLRYERRFSSLTVNTEYTFRVRLRATTGTVLWSDEITATTKKFDDLEDNSGYDLSAQNTFFSASNPTLAHALANPDDYTAVVEWNDTLPPTRTVDAQGDIRARSRVQLVWHVDNVADLVDGTVDVPPLVGIEIVDTGYRIRACPEETPL